MRGRHAGRRRAVRSRTGKMLWVAVPVLAGGVVAVLVGVRATSGAEGGGPAAVAGWGRTPVSGPGASALGGTGGAALPDGPAATPEGSGARPAGGSLAARGADAKDDHRHTDRQAADYFHASWGVGDKALRRMKDIRTVGGYLRIYTDLPDSAHDSSTAITLCERGLAYLRARGVAEPVVFVHARTGGNGNPVLANILGDSDRTCRVSRPARR
ncbi:hypothetical protein [Nonomuraea maritima]|uniref:hypothetical protein n=1 Tax=Nonomuraea maritima TaxID=683260 RepID=UPI003715475E